MSNSHEAILDAIIHSNPTENDLPLLQKGKYDNVVNYCKDFPFPKSSSDACKNEIREIISQTKNPVLREENSLQRFIQIDSNPVQAFQEIICSFLPDAEHASVNEIIADIYSKVEPIAIRLKYHYNRPRPSVIAAYLKAPLFAHNSLNLTKPSYPSVTVMAASCIAGVLSSKYPEIANDMQQMVHYITVSRLVLGLNYMSDAELSQIAAGKLMSENEFSAIYGV